MQTSKVITTPYLISLAVFSFALISWAPEALASAARALPGAQSTAQTGAATSAGTAAAAGQSQSAVEFQNTAPLNPGVGAMPSSGSNDNAAVGNPASGNSGVGGLQLRGVGSATSVGRQSPPQVTGNVETFFQCAPTTPLSKVKNAEAKFVSPNNPQQKEKEKRNRDGSVKRLLWHVLDNAGVPMVSGIQDGLDPDIQRNHVYTVGATSDQNPHVSDTPINSQTNHQKIPLSELEGTDSVVKNDAPATKH